MNRPGRASESRPQATTSSRSSRAAPRPFFGAPDKKLFNLFNYLIFELFLFAGNNVITLVGRSASDLSQARITSPPPPHPLTHPRREGKRDERREGVTEGGEGARERGERGERGEGRRGGGEGGREGWGGGERGRLRIYAFVSLHAYAPTHMALRVCLYAYGSTLARVRPLRLRTCVFTSVRDRRPGRRQMEERPDEVIYVERVLYVYVHVLTLSRVLT